MDKYVVEKSNKTIYLGSKVTVSDPCYEPGIWCASVLNNVLPGTYHVFIKRYLSNKYGNRISQLIVKHEDYLDAEIAVPDKDSDEDDTICLCVDSGQMGIFDNDFYVAFHKKLKEDPNYDYGINYSKGYDVWRKSVVSLAGFGDGDYPLYLKENDNGQVVGMKIIFIRD